MAVRQYIGARYVTKIYENSLDPSSAEWEANVNYEPLTLVTFNNGSYLSKKAVPASVGNPASNPTYWVQTGFYNGQIAQLQNDINTLNSDVTKLKGNLLVIGNSYSSYGCVNDLGSDFEHMYLNAEGGTGFIPYSGHPRTFVDQLTDSIADTSFNNDTITDILFVSAVGDCKAWTADRNNFVASLQSALTSIETLISNNFTNVKRVMVVFAETRSVAYIGTGNIYSALFAVHKNFKNQLANYGIEYLGWPGFNLLMEAGYTEADNYHPNAAGVKYLGTLIKSAYYGALEYKVLYSSGNCDFNYVTGAKCTIIANITPDECEIHMRAASLSSGATVTLTANSILIDVSQLSVPLPPSLSFSHVVTAHMVAPNTGASQDYLRLNIGDPDVNGIATIVNVTAPTAATVSQTSVVISELCNIGYKF